jgi:hypothetical protein
MDYNLLEKFFGALEKVATFFDYSEKLKIIRALRGLYFYPDGLLKHLTEVIENPNSDIDTAIAGGSEFNRTVQEADELLDFITSDSLIGNLKVPLEIVDELKRLADYKVGIRGYLHAIFFTWTFERDRAKVVEFASQVRSQIEFLNSRIIHLEKQLLNKKVNE